MLPTAVVLAGGRGSRLAGIVDDVPKPLLPVAGLPFLEWVTAWLVGQGVDDVVYSAGHLGDQVERWVDERATMLLRRAVCRREVAPMGTGGAVLACLDLVTDLLLVVNGDTLLLTEIGPLVARLRDQHLDGLIVAVRVADASRFGTLIVDEDGLLLSIQEKRPGAGLVNGGVYLFRRPYLEQRLPARPASLENEILPDMLQQGGRLGVAPVDAPFIDIGVPESLVTAATFVESNRRLLPSPVPLNRS